MGVTLRSYAVTLRNHVATLRKNGWFENSSFKKMRYYTLKQAAMLNRVARFLKENREVLVERVPALKEVIEEYLKMEEGINTGQNTPLLWQPRVSTLEKKITRAGFEEIVLKLTSALAVAASRTKQKKQEVKDYTPNALKKLKAAALCNVYIKAMSAMKKTRNPEFYGLTDDFLAEAKAYYHEFNTIKNEPANKKKSRGEWFKALEDAISDALVFLKKTLDPLMRVAGTHDPAMRGHYKGARTVQIRTFGRPADKEVAFRKSRMKKPKGDAADALP